MTEQAVAYHPDPATRPTQVRWAFRLWLGSGVLLVALGVYLLIASLFETAWHLDRLAVEVLVIILGLAYISLARKACMGAQWRGSLAALTSVVAVMLLVLTVGFQSGLLAAVFAASVVGLAATILAYRPAADAWFTGKAKDCGNAGGKTKGRNAQ
ncbi:hypothetical protein MUG78_03660 [Gordonia alkaliphila]|uniref:Uncharacterized protein n=1 Tax=Gordonia alkaliphila TaxID=1053547 RepID=A0ABP8Z2F2_9ACTN|nr:hypothetical protein [Gordonia alkaliphila]MCK0438583.1 hypothetical protein [Gordonia alkaliphila]